MDNFIPLLPVKRKTKPKIEIDLQEVEQLAAQGLTQEQIASSLGISQDTLYTRKRESIEFSEAIKKGKAQGIRYVSNLLFEQAKEGNMTAIIFYLKTRAGWSEREPFIRDKINLPRVKEAKDLSLAIEKVIQTVSNGQLSLLEADILSRLFEQQRKMFEITDIEKRLFEAEKALAEKVEKTKPGYQFEN
jgi:predicted DNA-binding protein (UPF0251 family)